MADNRPVFVLVTAATCGHCSTFRATSWTETKRLLGDKVKIADIELPSTQSNIPGPYPATLKKYVGWFPTFILFSAADWKSGALSSGEIFNGRVEASGPFYTGGKEASPAELSNWVNNTIPKLSMSAIQPNFGHNGMAAKTGNTMNVAKSGSTGVCSTRYTARK